MSDKFIVVIDPGLNVAEVECFEKIQKLTKRECRYFTPGLKAEKDLFVIDPDDIYAIFIFGGSASLTENISWRVELEKWFRRCMDHQVPTLAFCWGHQWIASLFGSDVIKIPGITEKILGKKKFIARHSKIFDGELSGELIVAHRFMVENIPSAAEQFLFSSNNYNEGLYYPGYNILTFQPHPEATIQFCLNNGIENIEPYTGDFGDLLILKALEYLT